jgi:hypothetical protein
MKLETPPEPRNTVNLQRLRGSLRGTPAAGGQMHQARFASLEIGDVGIVRR